MYRSVIVLYSYNVEFDSTPSSTAMNKEVDVPLCI